MANFSEGQMTDIIYMYTVQNLSMEKIGNFFGVNAGDISNALKPYHFGGKENKYGNSNFQGGFYKGLYRNGYKDPYGNLHREIQITRDLLAGYVRQNYYDSDKETLQDYLFNNISHNFSFIKR